MFIRGLRALSCSLDQQCDNRPCFLPPSAHLHANSLSSSFAQTFHQVPWLLLIPFVGLLLSVLFRFCGVVCRTCWRRCSSRRNSSSSSGSSDMSDVEIADPVPVPMPVWSGALTVCTICMEEFADWEAVRVLQLCGHGYQKRCVDAWLMKKAPRPSSPPPLPSPPPSNSRCCRCRRRR